MTSIKKGDVVSARTAEDQWVTLRAASGVTKGLDFPVVWLMEEERWAAAAASDDPRKTAIPWPVEDVRAEGGTL